MFASVTKRADLVVENGARALAAAASAADVLASRTGAALPAVAMTLRHRQRNSSIVAACNIVAQTEQVCSKVGVLGDRQPHNRMLLRGRQLRPSRHSAAASATQNACSGCAVTATHTISLFVGCSSTSFLHSHAVPLPHWPLRLSFPRVQGARAHVLRVGGAFKDINRFNTLVQQALHRFINFGA